MRNNLGILLPVASLEGNHGIGDFGYPSFRFIKWLSKNNYKYWQVLPLNPVGPGNSPYMSTCSYALEPRYISLDLLVKEGLLKRVPKFKKNATKVDYQATLWFKDKYLYKAYKNFMKKPYRGYNKFKRENPWLVPYAIFLTLRLRNNYVMWNRWRREDLDLLNLKKPTPEFQDIVEFESFKQFIAFRQWDKVRKYAKSKNVTIIADCPFYVGIDSID